MGDLKNPFSISEFLGYVFPGAIGLTIIYLFTQGCVNITKADDLVDIIPKYEEIAFIYKTDSIVFFTLISYIFGHYISYVSSLTIEQFSIWSYGYPSEYLLVKNNSQPKKFKVHREYNNFVDIIWNIEDIIFTKFEIKCEGIRYVKRTINKWRFLLVFLLFPITIGTILISWLLGAKGFFIKNMEDELIDTINYKVKMLAKHLSIDASGENKDFHRSIYHYEYEHQKLHTYRTDNCVALYDFLRALTLISNCLFLFVLYTYITVCQNIVVFHSLILLFVLTYVFYIAYLKFYRRFTQENFMCLVIDNSFMPKDK